MKLSELTFKPLTSGFNGEYTSAFFNNGFGAFITKGDQFKTNDSAPYELMVLKGPKESAIQTCETPITNDILIYQTEQDINNALNSISLL